MTVQLDVPAEPGEAPPDTTDEPETPPNHPLRAQDVQALISKEIG